MDQLPLGDYNLWCVTSQKNKELILAVLAIQHIKKHLTEFINKLEFKVIKNRILYKAFIGSDNTTMQYGIWNFVQR